MGRDITIPFHAYVSYEAEASRHGYLGRHRSTPNITPIGVPVRRTVKIVMGEAHVCMKCPGVMGIGDD